MKQKYLMLSIIVFLLLPVVSFAQDESRYALVIGNGTYTDLSFLNNPVNDANDMAMTLTNLGFTVDKLTNVTLQEMESAVVRLGNKLSQTTNGYGFFYYAGHGVQSSGNNYLIPIDADIPNESFLKTKSLAMQAVLDTLQQAGNGLNIVVLDACRDNPFSWSRSGSRGLSVIGTQPPLSIIVYATSAGSVAQDGNGRNGLFTSQLLKNIETPDIDINEVFKRTGAGVMAASGNRQVPAIYSQFFGTVYLNQIDGNDTKSLINTPEGFVLVEAGSFMMGSTNGDSDEQPVHTVTITKNFYMSEIETTWARWKTVYDWAVQNGYTFFNPGQAGNDGLGSDTADEPVTMIDWRDAIVWCNAASEMEGFACAYTYQGSVVKDSMNSRACDNAVCDFSVHGYRLPTEAEWEYAAKGGQHDADSGIYAGSNTVGDVAWYSGNSNSDRHPVGTRKANEIGLYDMSGNVGEWCWDWFGHYSGTDETDSTGVDNGSDRVLRGGYWNNSCSLLRCAYRGCGDPFYRSGSIGFRLCRTAD